MLNFLLFLIAWVLWLPLTFINYFLVKGDYFLSSAISLDRYANREFRTLWNKTLRLESGYKFGNIGETISSVLGKNQRDNTLSTIGKVLCYILDKLDKDHCIKSINNNI
jgi:hypothetical protein